MTSETKSELLMLLALAAVCWGTDRLSAQGFSLPDSPLDGQRVFVEKGCVRCHSIMGEGGKIGSDLAKMHADHSPAGIIAMMWNHASDMRKAMEAWQTVPKLNERELANLVAYLFSISYFDNPGDPTRGKAVYQRSGCQKCHTVGGIGGTVGPLLDTVKQFGSALFLAQAMWNHGLEMSRAMKRRGVERATFHGSEIADLFSYLHSISDTTIEIRRYMNPGNPRNGEKLFQAKGCINCHKVGATGGVIGPDLSKKEFHEGAIAIAGSMWNHGSTMWTRMKDLKMLPPKLQGNDMADVVSYLYFLKFRQRTGDPVHGKELAETKGCTTCHTIGGRGGVIGPELAQSQHFSSPLAVAAQMWNHNLDMQKRMAASRIPFPRFTEHEMIDLLAYIRSE